MSADAARIANDLYALTPDEFTAARDAAAKAARDDGDRELANTVKQFRRPSIGAWLVNVVARTDQLDDLLDLGAALREAQRTLDGNELRAMSRQRHQVIRSLSQLAHELTGKKVGDAAQREFEATLEAALADDAAADAVRTGRLMRALTSTGLEPVDLTDAVAAPDHAAPPRRPVTKKPAPKQKSDDKAARDKRAAELAAAIAAAEDALAIAQDELDRRDHELDEARTEVDDARARVKELEAELDGARENQSAAEKSRREAETARKSAARSRDAAQRALDTARTRS
jgi:hypothetical protein